MALYVTNLQHRGRRGADLCPVRTALLVSDDPASAELDRAVERFKIWAPVADRKANAVHVEHRQRCALVDGGIAKPIDWQRLQALIEAARGEVIPPAPDYLNGARRRRQPRPTCVA
jgi:hypothetical protein